MLRNVCNLNFFSVLIITNCKLKVKVDLSIEEFNVLIAMNSNCDYK